MGEQIISVRVDESIHTQMRLHDEINWSAVLRSAVVEKLEKLDKIDVDRAKKAAKSIDILRKSKIFDKGKLTLEIIKEWRQKRK